MPLIRLDPFRELDRFFDGDWGVVPMMRGGLHMMHFPRMDVYQTDNDVVVEIQVPAGIDPEKVDISIEGDTLTARGSVEEERSEEDKEKNYFRKEIRKGSFERSVMLPAAVKADLANAVFEKGILKVTIPKAEEEKVKKVEVKVKK